jgi:hypothetical protein
MTKHRSTQIKITVIVSVSLVIAAVTYGFAQANIANTAGIMGAGYGVISSFEVSNINYILDVEDPTNFNSVSFMLDQETSQIQTGISATKNGKIIWAEECEVIGTRWSCYFEEEVELLSADWLHVTSAN